jgi:hypothetical protein
LTAGLNGLNWQVQVWPCSLEMVTVPPCLYVGAALLAGALLAGGLVVAGALELAAGEDPAADGVAVLALWPLLPHAAANRPAVTAMAAPFIRLIVLAPHSFVRQALRLSENGTPD